VLTILALAPFVTNAMMSMQSPARNALNGLTTMTEQLGMALDLLQARHAGRQGYEADLGEVVVTAEELSTALELADAAGNAPWIIEAGPHAGHNWPIAFFGQDEDNQQYQVTTDSVRGSERNGSTAKDDAEFVAHMHPIRVIRFVKEIERLRMELWRCRQVSDES
jgi:hypothetical protein